MKRLFLIISFLLGLIDISDAFRMIDLEADKARSGLPTFTFEIETLMLSEQALSVQNTMLIDPFTQAKPLYGIQPEDGVGLPSAVYLTIFLAPALHEGDRVPTNRSSPLILRKRSDIWSLETLVNRLKILGLALLVGLILKKLSGLSLRR